MTEDTQQLTRDVFKSDMKTAVKMNELVQGHNPEEVAQSSVDVVNEMVDKIDDPIREKCLYATCYQIGNSLQNQQLMQFAAEQLERWQQEHE